MVKLNFQTQTLLRLRQRISCGAYDFLGFSLDLETGVLTDRLNTSLEVNERGTQIFSILLDHYAAGNPVPLIGRLVKFKDLPGGCAYEGAFVKRAIDPVPAAFGTKPEELLRSAELLGGKHLGIGDASVEIPVLKGIPLTYILWKAEEFAASATILYDESASNYLPTEDLAVLGEITTARLIQAKAVFSTKE